MSDLGFRLGRKEPQQTRSAPQPPCVACVKNRSLPTRPLKNQPPKHFRHMKIRLRRPRSSPSRIESWLAGSLNPKKIDSPLRRLIKLRHQAFHRQSQLRHPRFSGLIYPHAPPHPAAQIPSFAVSYIQIDPKSAGGYNGRAIIEQTRGDFAAAKSDYDHSLKIDGNDVTPPAPEAEAALVRSSSLRDRCCWSLAGPGHRREHRPERY